MLKVPPSVKNHLPSLSFVKTISLLFQSFLFGGVYRQNVYLFETKLRREAAGDRVDHVSQVAVVQREASHQTFPFGA